LQRQVAGLAGSTSPKLHGMHHPATATHLRSKSRCVTTTLLGGSRLATAGAACRARSASC
jgi:hypothetical protein